MPLFDFHCCDCGETMELLLRQSDEPVCAKCGGKQLERLVSRTAPPGKAKAMAASARAQARREGHLSNFS